MKKIRVNREHLKQKIKKVKRYAWYKPALLLAAVLLVIGVIYSSAAVARVSAQKKISLQAYNQQMEQAGALDGSVYDIQMADGGSDNAYDLLYDEEEEKKTSKESGIMVTIGNLYDRITGGSDDRDSDREVVITSEADNNNSTSGTAKELAKMEERIKESVLSQMTTTSTQIVEGASGRDGVDGEKGDRGETGARGPQGPAGQTGASGKTGSVGATGEKGDTGEAGKDGLSTFIVYADTVDGKNMSMTPKETSKYIGTYQGTVRSSDPKDYTWTEYKDKVITYTNDDGKPTIHIFN